MAACSYLQNELLSWISGEGRVEVSFDEMALRVFRHQMEKNRPYQRYCEALGRDEVSTWREIPALPTDAFKFPPYPLRCFSAEETARFFLTSGTTREVRGCHEFRTLDLYEASIRHGWKSLELPEIPNPWFLSQTPEVAPNSSLVHMFHALAEVPRERWLIDAEGRMDLSKLARETQPVAFFSTALALLRMMESQSPVTLPAGSWVFETGGYKGLTETLEPEEFRRRLADFFQIPAYRILNEYSMTELSSQFYRWPGEPCHRGPEWTRIRVIDPETGLPAADGEPGYLEIIDLANLNSVMAIRTQDLAIARGDSAFLLLGRDPGALPRGCSRASDDLLSTGRELSPRSPAVVTLGTTLPEVFPDSRVESRIDALLDQAENLQPWVGSYNRESLLELLRQEFGSERALDGFIKSGRIFSKAIPLSPVLHVVSGNTPHAAFQSVFRGLLVGTHNRVKLPSAGLPEFEAWVATLPPVLSSLIEISHSLPDEWLSCQAAVIFGGAATIETFRNRLPGGTRIIEHGPKLGIAVILDPSEQAATLVAEDILRHDQRGCLSVQAIYVDASEQEIYGFLNHLAAALQSYRQANPRPVPSLSDSGAVANFRELTRFRAANGENAIILESESSTDWTIIYDENPRLAPGPLNGTVTVHPLPPEISAKTLGAETAHLSTVVLHPFTLENSARLDGLSPTRICALGQAQDPTIFWHHDGGQPLASLVRWRDLG